MPNADKLEAYATQYFTGAQASIWIDDIWVDEVFGIQFSASKSVIPIFGYASSFFDAIANGKVLVHGVFEINFIDEGYLYAILNERANKLRGLKESEDAIEIARIKGIPIAPEEETLTVYGSRNESGKRDAASIITEQLQLLQELANGTTPDVVSRRQVVGTVMNQIAQLDYISLNEMASELNRAQNPAPVRNIIYELIPFTLKGYFGNPELGGMSQGTYKEIQDCFLIGNEMIIGGSDDIIKERYNFLARVHV